METARALCQHLIAANPRNAEALNLAGLIESGRDRLAGRTLIGNALAVREDPVFLVNFATTSLRPQIVTSPSGRCTAQLNCGPIFPWH